MGFHDADWQDGFGGNFYLENGSHGCVNMPDDAVEKLYQLSYVNMPVYVYY
ncbi:MAG: L,D-transpeptidase [Acutalibacteraceae bacterium]|nr:L,D-transpeptidase [Acutalibacteraceae bacterium]